MAWGLRMESVMNAPFLQESDMAVAADAAATVHHSEQQECRTLRLMCIFTKRYRRSQQSFAVCYCMLGDMFMVLGYMFTTIFKVLFVEIYANVAFVMNRLYGTVSLTLVGEQKNYYY